jgi:2TM domain
MSHLEEDIYYKAKKRVKAKKGFYTHLGVYLATGVFFFLMNMLTWDGEPWFMYPLLPWGVGLAIQGFSVFGLPGGKMSERWEEEELQKEMERQRRIHGVKEPEAMELPEDELELKEFKKLREEWDDKDFV